MERWYHIRGGVRVGPVTWEQLLELVRSGELQPTHKLMKEGTGRWRPASETPGLFGGPAPAPAGANTPLPARPQPVAPAASPAKPAASPPVAAAPAAKPPVAARPVAAPAASAPAKPAASAPAPARPAAPVPAASAKPAAPAPAAPVKPVAVAPAAAAPAKPAAAPAVPAAPTPAAVGGWFYVQDKKKLGPVSTADLKKLADAGTLKPGDMVMRGGQDKWRAASEVPGLFPAVAAPAPTVAPAPMPVVAVPVPAPAMPVVAVPVPAPAAVAAPIAPAAVPVRAPVAPAPAPVAAAVPARAPVAVAVPARAPVAAAAPVPAPVAARPQNDILDEDSVYDDDGSDDDDEIDVDAFLDRAAACKTKGDFAGAAKEYDMLVKMLPDEPEGYSGLARLWATCTDAKVRNGAKAVEYARMAVELASNAESAAEDEEEIEDCVALRLHCQETLALAQAETGDFKAAIATIDSFRDEADKGDQRRLKKLREQFKAKQPLRE